MAKQLILLSMAISMLINLNANNSRRAENLQRMREGQHIIISPTEFLSQANQLADFYWTEFQINREIIDQQDIFDQMSGGMAEPEAIHDYLMIFFDDPTTWSNSSVLLLGSGTIDWNILDEKNRIVVLGISDDEFVMLDNDNVPDVPIGRLPAQNVQQAQRLINRNIQYISEPNYGWWQNKMLILADDEWKAGQLEGLTYNSGLNHTARAQDLTELISDAVWVDKLLGIEYDMNAWGFKPEASQSLIEKINDGRLIWHFIGHGNDNLLGDEEYFSVSTQLPLLQNSDLLPLFTAASGKVGDFSSLDYDCMAEQFLTYEFGGTIASIASRAPTSGTLNSQLFMAFYQKLINDYEYLGSALLQAKTANPSSIYNNLNYNILGDPLLFLNLPERDENITISGNPSVLYYNDQIEITGILPSSNYLECEFKAFESEYDCFYSNTLNGVIYEVEYTKFGVPYHEEDIAITGLDYSTSFYVASGIQTGDEARMISYIHGDVGDYVQYIHPITISDGTNSPEIPTPPNELSAFNYPNPFNPCTTIIYSLPADTKVNITIYNIKSQLVRQLLNENKSAGEYAVIWDGKDNSGLVVSGGIYFFQVKTDRDTTLKKMILLK